MIKEAKPNNTKSEFELYSFSSPENRFLVKPVKV